MSATRASHLNSETNRNHHFVEVSLHLSLDPLQVVNTGTVSPKMAVLESGQLRTSQVMKSRHV